MKARYLRYLLCFGFQVFATESNIYSGGTSHLKTIVSGNTQSLRIYRKTGDQLRRIEHTIASKDYDLLIKQIYESKHEYEYLFVGLRTFVQTMQFSERYFLLSSDSIATTLRRINSQAEPIMEFSTALSKQYEFLNLIYRRMERAAYYISETAQFPRQESSSTLLNMASLSVEIIQYFDSYGNFDPKSNVILEDLESLLETANAWKREIKLTAGIRVDSKLVFDDSYMWVQEMLTHLIKHYAQDGDRSLSRYIFTG